MDPSSRVRSLFLLRNPATRPAANIFFHLDTGEKKGPNLEVGDWLVARYGDPPNKIFLSNCRDSTIKDVTMLRNGFAPIFEDAGGGNHVLNCHWKLGPKPDGASDEPLVTNMADGLHSVGASPGPDIENCTFEGFFLDDCIAIHGDFQKIQSADGANLVVKDGYAHLTVGETRPHLRREGLLRRGHGRRTYQSQQRCDFCDPRHSAGYSACKAKLSNPFAQWRRL